MAAREKNNSINLLPNLQDEANVKARVLNWVLSSFRVIVIITEFVVILAFISRFFLDARSNDLTDQIKSKQAVIASFSKFENEFKNIQAKISIFSSITSEKNLNSSVFSKITSSLPNDIVLDSLTSDKDGINLKADSFSEQSIVQLISNLKATNLFSDITLTGFDMSEDNPFVTFTIKLNKV